MATKPFIECFLRAASLFPLKVPSAAALRRGQASLAFSVTHRGATKSFVAPPADVSAGAVEWAVASQFGLAVGSFGISIRGGSQAGTAGSFHAALRGDWDIVMIPGTLISTPAPQPPLCQIPLPQSINSRRAKETRKQDRKASLNG